jgi:hypothetical protein
MLRAPTKIIVDNSNGWVAGSSSGSGFNDDDTSTSGALRTQIQLVESYIKEAKSQNKTNEVEMLERNLSELLNALVDTSK